MKAKTNNFLSPLLLNLAALLGFGLIALYSASAVESYQNFGNTTHYIYHQLLYGAVLGLICMWITAKIDYHLWQKYLPGLLLLSLVLLAAVKLSNLGFGSGGAERWLKLGPLTFQPSELAKLVIIFYIASWVDKRRHQLNDFYFGLLPTISIIVIYSCLILWQPDLGTMMVLVLVAFALLFAAGIDMQFFVASFVLGALGLYLLIKFEPYRLKRLTTFFNPGIDPQGISYHINQALLAVGSGKIFGYGYGLSRQKHNYLPEAMNDSIFAVTAEELGFARVILILILFGLFIWQGANIAKRAPDTFGRMTALGITLWIGLQAIINIAAMVSLLPLTGIPLPFFSYGSTALVINLASVGILINIAKQS